MEIPSGHLLRYKSAGYLRQNQVSTHRPHSGAFLYWWLVEWFFCSSNLAVWGRKAGTSNPIPIVSWCAECQCEYLWLDSNVAQPIWDKVWNMLDRNWAKKQWQTNQSSRALRNLKKALHCSATPAASGAAATAAQAPAQARSSSASTAQAAASSAQAAAHSAKLQEWPAGTSLGKRFSPVLRG